MAEIIPLMDRIPFWVLGLIVIALIGFPSGAGYWVGRRTAKDKAHSEQPVGTKVGATLGLLAFTLAFTFAMAAGRYDSRRQAVTEEAYTLEIAYRRAGLLPADHGAQVRQLLREYIDIRLAAVADVTKMTEALARTRELQDELWRHALEVAARDSTSWTAAWFIESLTDLTKLHTRRVGAGLHSRVPPTIWLALGLICMLSMLAMGYQAGLSGGLRIFPMTMLVLAFATIIALIADLDRPQDGMLKIGQTSLTEAQKVMHRDLQASPAVPD